MIPQTPPPVMILGCGRSGTSIFGELFEHLAIYTYRSEPPFAEVLAADFTLPLAFKVPCESNDYPGQPGLSFPLGVLLRTQPDMKFFWIVRHPLDAICSLRIGISQNWGHHPKPPDWRDWRAKSLIEQCAHHWAFLNSAGFSQIEAIAMLVRFEDMITAPRDFACSVLTGLGLNPAHHALALDEWSRRVQNTNNADFIEAETSRPYSRADHSTRIGRWRENLTARDVAEALPIVAKTADALGYDMPEACRPV